MQLRRLSGPIVDGENNPVLLDVAYSIKGCEFLDSMSEIRERHGEDICLLPLSGTSAGGGVFQITRPQGKTVVGLQFTATASPKVSVSSSVQLSDVALDEIVIEAQNNKIYAGSAITLEQLNQALAEKIGSHYKVLGADLTSYAYAQVGATFMTGGMGPQRRYFSDSVIEVALYDGDIVTMIRGDMLGAYAGTFGWSGLVCAVCCEFHELPFNEIAFAIPVNNKAEELARLLAHFSRFTYFNFEDGKAVTHHGETDLILGLEHITVDSMQPYLQSGDNALIDRTRTLVSHCASADADGLLFVNGFSDLAADEFLFTLVDDAEADTFTIAGINLEYTEIFNDPNQMRAIREGIPFTARTQSPKGRFVYKGHTDATIRINTEKVEKTVDTLWQTNQKYVHAVNSFFAKHENIRGDIIVYGHLNPFGIDPHNRITFACDNESDYKNAEDYIHQQRDVFYRSLETICQSSGSEFIGGEKSAASEADIFEAFDTINQAPASLQKKFACQVKAICRASPMFSWRAPPLYR